MGTADARPGRDPAVPGEHASPESLIFDNPSAALRVASAALAYVHGCAAQLDGASCGELLVALSRAQARLSATNAAVLRRFDAADAHDADGYGSSSSWLAAKAGLPGKAARSAVRQMRQLTERPLLETALAAGTVTDSLAFTIAGWTRKLPAGMRTETDHILLEAAAAGATLDDLAVIAACAIEKWRQQQPDPDTPDDGFEDRSVRLEVTFGGAAVLRGDLTPECATAVRAVLEALGKKQGPEDERTEEKRFHDALQMACALLLRARLVPDRAGADTQAVVHIPLSQLRERAGAPDVEEAWIRARLGEDGFLAGPGAQVASCDAQTVPVVTGTLDPDVIDKMIGLARAAAEAELAGPVDGTAGADPAGPCPVPTKPVGTQAASRAQPLPPRPPSPPLPSPGARLALRHAIARLAIDLVSGPAGIAAALRQGLLAPPYSTPSLPLDIGYSHTIPGHLRRAVALRDKHCAWPKCTRPAVYCDIHHLRHQADGGETSVANCALVCQFHHDTCIHRRGWQLILHPDGTTEARSPDGRQVLHSHPPPTSRAG